MRPADDRVDGGGTGDGVDGVVAASRREEQGIDVRVGQARAGPNRLSPAAAPTWVGETLAVVFAVEPVSLTFSESTPVPALTVTGPRIVLTFPPIVLPFESSTIVSSPASPLMVVIRPAVVPWMVNVSPPSPPLILSRSTVPMSSVNGPRLTD